MSSEAPRNDKKHPVSRWVAKVFSRSEQREYSLDSTKYWEYIAGSPPDEDLIFKPLAEHYYEISSVIPAEGVVEGFFRLAASSSIPGAITFQMQA
jgi:hypothetical protein